MESIKLNNGLECPAIGIGTFMLTPADAQNSVREALMMGYRLIDTATLPHTAPDRTLVHIGVCRVDEPIAHL